ncbi:uncharacterized protein EDB93DRAFT_1100311 [Suillus bovinus]|uniref:uncharacterized protein n=1 Tax=Suillus bovinus TaxID=48563 RepID=UPI001B87D4AF|nr:uncharacterized protein EDB93DRAFT_1100311 [Suillus bovinus]KAG2158666.1 hypothetical protein EDB93DRAFT_1100311 [Suillus bovinus]
MPPHAQLLHSFLLLVKSSCVIQDAAPWRDDLCCGLNEAGLLEDDSKAALAAAVLVRNELAILYLCRLQMGAFRVHRGIPRDPFYAMDLVNPWETRMIARPEKDHPGRCDQHYLHNITTLLGLVRVVVTRRNGSITAQMLRRIKKGSGII